LFYKALHKTEARQKDWRRDYEVKIPAGFDGMSGWFVYRFSAKQK